MKLNRTYLFIIFSSLALVVLLLIQVSWLFQSAKMKEELFNEKANMVLSRTAQELCSDVETCSNMGSCCVDPEKEECSLKLGKSEMNRIDSLLKKYMTLYDFHIDYTYEVIQPGIIATAKGWGGTKSGNVFKRRLEEAASRNGLELKLIFPDKKHFIREQMGGMFVSSVLLIIVVLALFWRTTMSLMKEKKISEMTTEFLNNMTHEFKTPLTNIALAGKLMTKNTSQGSEEKLKHYAGIILDENEKLRLQVEQVLSMTALERGEIRLVKSDFDFHDLLNNLVKCMSLQVENKGGHIYFERNAEHSVLFADRDQLSNAICNVIDNGIKYSGEKPELEIKTYNEGDSLVLRVSDKGIGIDKASQQKVFEKFYRVPTGDKHDVKGFGLGLAYVKKIIELHKGKVELQSEKGVGSTFIITLPLNES